MGFPAHKFDSVESYATAYFAGAGAAMKSVDLAKLRQAAELLEATHRARRMLYTCGNGGSAAIANHLVCDHSKGVHTDTELTPRVVSLSTNIELMTAIANDLSYDDVFVYQLSLLAQPDDVLLVISSSGDSENVVRAVKWARQQGLKTIGMTGFAGGRTSQLVDISLHVDASNYGIVEDIHQSLMHILAQHLRQAHMPEELVRQRKF